MDFAAPIDNLIPGARGRVLSALARADVEHTMRGLAREASVSSNHVGKIVADLDELGIVERRDLGPASLVRLSRTNIVAESIRHLADLTQAVLDEMSETAQQITPPPLSLIVFGSLVRGQASRSSDIDVAAVCEGGVHLREDFSEALWSWAEHMMSRTGNPVNLILEDVDTVRISLQQGSGLWESIRQDGICLLGIPPKDFLP